MREPKEFIIVSTMLTAIAVGLSVPPVPYNFMITSTVPVTVLGYSLYKCRTSGKEGSSYAAGIILMMLGTLIVGYDIGLTLPKLNNRILFAGLCVVWTGACLALWGLGKRIGLSNADVVRMLCVLAAMFPILAWLMWDEL